MQKFASVHPIVSKIDNNGPNCYIVHESLKFGFIPFSFTYPIKVEKSKLDYTVTINATVFKLTKIMIKFCLEADNNYTAIEEEVTFNSPLPIKSIMENTFKQQHRKLFKNIENIK